jgi:hypothetical protein
VKGSVILQADPVVPLIPDEVFAVFRPYLTAPWAVAGTA